jgi:uncharacterized protein YciI
MRITTIILLVLLFVAPQIFVVGQEKTEPQFKLVEFQMSLLKRGPKWDVTQTKETTPLHQQHIAYVQSLLESGKAVIAGPLGDDGEVRGIYIFRTKSADEARGWAENDPAVKAGHLSVEMHPWWAEDVMRQASSPIKLTTAYIAFLSRGPKWTPEKTAQTEELQKAHLANIRKLADMKKLVVAGPFGDKGPLAGIFVFRVASLDEAKELAATDPAVQAGRLALDIHPWLVPEGILP